MITERPCVLSIAGLDPSAGAGVLADVKTIEQCGVYGLGVTTAITYQNEDEFDGVSWLSFEEIEKQLEPLLRKYQIEVVKIGLIQNMEVLSKLILLLTSRYSLIKIIWDPILSASAGFDFHSELNKEKLKGIISSIYLVTPNQIEFDKMNLEIESFNSILIKGGHNKVHDDILFETVDTREETRKTVIKGSTKKLYPKHGSGCVLSSAIASYLALGNDLPLACELGKKYVEAFLESNEGLLGYHL